MGTGRSQGDADRQRRTPWREIGRSGAGWRPCSARRRRVTVRLGRVFWDPLAIAVAHFGERHQGRVLHPELDVRPSSQGTSTSFPFAAERSSIS
jgi:hypothetical protein